MNNGTEEVTKKFTFPEKVDNVRTSIKNIAQLLKEVKNNRRNSVEHDNEDRDDVIANFDLAYRHLEDASMRLGKVLQATDINNFDLDSNVKFPKEIEKPSGQCGQCLQKPEK